MLVNIIDWITHSEKTLIYLNYSVYKTNQRIGKMNLRMEESWKNWRRVKEKGGQEEKVRRKTGGFGWQGGKLTREKGDEREDTRNIV